jgi:phage regulator Rha-like protein
MNNLKLNKEVMTSREIAEVTGKPHNDVLKAIRAMEGAWYKVTKGNFSLSEYTDSTGRKLPMYELTKVECLYIATKFNDEARAKLILRWEALETGKAKPAKEELTIADKLKVATWAAEFLNLNDNSKLIMAKSILDPLGLPIPDYTPSHGILKSATDKANGSDLSAKAFNILAINEGYLEEKTRRTTKGESKKFKSITAKGRLYGENQVSPNNPKETQPLWYEDKFEELLNHIN